MQMGRLEHRRVRYVPEAVGPEPGQRGAVEGFLEMVL